MDFDQDRDQGLFLDLERVAKGLSIGCDGLSMTELRRLFRQAESDLGLQGEAERIPSTARE